jgi:metal transporter CNNM
MVEGALSMKTKVVMDVYTPLRRVFSIPENTLLDERNTVRIYSSGYSRVPVFRPNPEKPKDKTQIIGILISKQLIVVNHHDCRPVSTLPLNIPFCVSPKMNLVDAINMFQTGGLGAKGGHLALVCARPDLGEAALDRREPLPESAGLMGIVTLEDALEQLLQEQILDEMDKLERNEARLAQWAYKKWRIFVKKEQLKRETDEVEALERPKMSSVVDQAVEQDRAKKMPPNIFSPLLGGKKSEGEDESGSRSFKLPFFS